MNPITLLVLFSTGIGVSIAVGAAFLYGANGPFMRSIALCFMAISVEIGIAIIADFYLNKPLTFVVLKMIGRSVEAVGVSWFFRQLVKIRTSPKAGLVSGELPPEFWSGDFRQAIRDTIKPEYLK